MQTDLKRKTLQRSAVLCQQQLCTSIFNPLILLLESMAVVRLHKFVQFYFLVLAHHKIF